VIDFTLTAEDKRLVALAREEAAISRKYARYYDQNEDELKPKEFPELMGRPSPIDQLRANPEGTSGLAITESLIHQQFGDVHLRRPTEGLGNMIVRYAGTPEQVEKFESKLLSIAMTEPGAGSDPAAIQGTARYDEASDEWILNGEKIYCSEFGAADGAVVMVRGLADGNGIKPFLAFVVEKGMPGLQELGQVKKMGLRSWDTADFVMQDCRVPRSNQLDLDFRRAMFVFNGTRPAVAAIGLSIARNLLDLVKKKLQESNESLNYAYGRFRQSSIQSRVLALEALHDATTLTILHCKWLEQRDGGANGSTMVEAATAKVIGGHAARRITQECMEMLGVDALTEDLLAEKWFRDARIFDIFEGAGEINRLIIARSLLGYSNKELN